MQAPSVCLSAYCIPSLQPYTVHSGMSQGSVSPGPHKQQLVPSSLLRLWGLPLTQRHYDTVKGLSRDSQGVGTLQPPISICTDVDGVSSWGTWIRSTPRDQRRPLGVGALWVLSPAAVPAPRTMPNSHPPPTEHSAAGQHFRRPKNQGRDNMQGWEAQVGERAPEGRES
jgi:hypothetical protein